MLFLQYTSEQPCGGGTAEPAALVAGFAVTAFVAGFDTGFVTGFVTGLVTGFVIDFVVGFVAGLETAGF